MEVYEVLEKALGEIEDPQDWLCQGWGEPEGGGPKCAIHAICHVVGDPWSKKGAPEAQLVLERYIGGGYLGDFNDRHTHAEVVDLFKRAIRSEKEKAGVPLEIPASSPVAA